MAFSPNRARAVANCRIVLADMDAGRANLGGQFHVVVDDQRNLVMLAQRVERLRLRQPARGVMALVAVLD